MMQCGGRKTERGAAACALARFAWRRVMSEVLLAAVWYDEEFLSYAATALRADREFILAAVQRNALCLGYASTELRADREVVLAAVKKDHHAVTCVPRLSCCGGGARARDGSSASRHSLPQVSYYAPLRADVYEGMSSWTQWRRMPGRARTIGGVPGRRGGRMLSGA